MTDKAIAKLLQRYLQNDLNDSEIERLADWVNSQDADHEIKALLGESWNAFETDQRIPDVHAKAMLENILTKAKQARPRKTSGVVKNIFWKRVAVAASVMLVTLIAANYFFTKNKGVETTVQTPANQDVKAPETNRAMITLASGQQIYLDSVGNGTMAMQGNVQIVKLANGQIGYQPASSNSTAEIIYNTLTNPRGSKVVNMVLSDGSKVWLNAGSSLTFPVAFPNSERNVSITGEAYFEIVHDASKPFIVAKKDVSVHVLGTHFNVNSYDDEDAVKVTLLEGKVNVVAGGNSKIIRPGQQAQVALFGNENIMVNQVDVEQVMAWKNGLFSFDEVGLREVMKQLERWYDVSVEYQGNIANLKFGGDIERSLSLSQVLEVLENSGVHFKIEGRKIIVLP